MPSFMPWFRCRLLHLNAHCVPRHAALATHPSQDAGQALVSPLALLQHHCWQLRSELQHYVCLHHPYVGARQLCETPAASQSSRELPGAPGRSAVRACGDSRPGKGRGECMQWDRALFGRVPCSLACGLTVVCLRPYPVCSVGSCRLLLLRPAARLGTLAYLIIIHFWLLALMM